MARNPLSPYRSAGLMERTFGNDPFLSLHREINRLFDDVFRGVAPTSDQQTGSMMPNMDVSETDKEVKICAELPGVSKDDVEVMLNDDVLTIRGEKKFERKDEKENYHFMERSYGTFQRILRLPYAVDPDQVKATFQDGILTLTIPKGKEQERSRRIQVSTGGGQTAPEQGEKSEKPSAGGKSEAIS